MTRRPRGARGPRRYKLTYETQVPAKKYAWVTFHKAFSGPGARDEDANFLERLPGIRNVKRVDPVTP